MGGKAVTGRVAQISEECAEEFIKRLGPAIEYLGQIPNILATAYLGDSHVASAADAIAANEGGRLHVYTDVENPLTAAQEGLKQYRDGLLG
jgi:hypothetical protein